MTTLSEDICRLKQLTQVDDWDEEGAPRICAEMWDSLARFASQVSESPIASPLSYGTVNLRWMRGMDCCDVEFDGSVYLVTRKEGFRFKVMENIDQDTALAELNEFLLCLKTNYDPQ